MKYKAIFLIFMCLFFNSDLQARGYRRSCEQIYGYETKEAQSCKRRRRIFGIIKLIIIGFIFIKNAKEKIDKDKEYDKVETTSKVVDTKGIFKKPKKPIDTKDIYKRWFMRYKAIFLIFICLFLNNVLQARGYVKSYPYISCEKLYAAETPQYKECKRNFYTKVSIFVAFCLFALIYAVIKVEMINKKRDNKTNKTIDKRDIFKDRLDKDMRDNDAL